MFVGYRAWSWSLLGLSTVGGGPGAPEEARCLRSGRVSGRMCTPVAAAPSKIVRPAGDRVKTDAKDAMLLARLLRMDEIVPVRVPSISEG